MDNDTAERVILSSAQNEIALRKMLHAAVYETDIPDQYRSRIVRLLTSMLEKSFEMTNKTIINDGLDMMDTLSYIATLMQATSELNKIGEEITRLENEQDFNVSEILDGVNKFYDELNKN